MTADPAPVGSSVWLVVGIQDGAETIFAAFANFDTAEAYQSELKADASFEEVTVEHLHVG